jgi:hypothetical protein
VVTANAPYRARCSASRSADGASSTTFWCRPLQAALALAEVDRAAVRVGEHLHLDVARAGDEALEEQRVVAEAARRLAARGRERLRQRRASCTRRMPLPPPPRTA